MMNIRELRAKRIALGISQKQVAKYLRVSKPAIGNYERGYSPINDEMLAKYNRYINSCINGGIEYNATNLSKYYARQYPKTREGYLILGSFD